MLTGGGGTPKVGNARERVDCRGVGGVRLLTPLRGLGAFRHTLSIRDIAPIRHGSTQRRRDERRDHREATRMLSSAVPLSALCLCAELQPHSSWGCQVTDTVARLPCLLVAHSLVCRGSTQRRRDERRDHREPTRMLSSAVPLSALCLCAELQPHSSCGCQVSRVTLCLLVAHSLVCRGSTQRRRDERRDHREATRMLSSAVPLSALCLCAELQPQSSWGCQVTDSRARSHFVYWWHIRRFASVQRRDEWRDHREATRMLSSAVPLSALCLCAELQPHRCVNYVVVLS
jgi:uncharacterized membrane protein